jgi:hypothetical protein
VLLIVGGALASGLLILRSGDRDGYLVVVRTVDPGQRISEDDLGVAQIAGNGANAISMASRADVVGDYATTRIFPGTLITEAMIADNVEIPNGQTVVGAVLSTSQRPAARLRPGDLVTVLAVPRSDGTGGEVSVVLLDSTEVVAVEDTSTNDALAVSLLVPNARVPAVTAAAAQGTVAVARLPGVASPDVGTEQQSSTEQPATRRPSTQPPATNTTPVSPATNQAPTQTASPAPPPGAGSDTAGTP